MLSIYTARINIYILLHTHIIYTNNLMLIREPQLANESEWNYWTSSIQHCPGGICWQSNLLFCGLIMRRCILSMIDCVSFIISSILRAELNRSRGLSLRCFSVSNLLREYTRPIAVGENILLMGCVVWSHVTQHAWILPAVDRRIPNLCRSVLFTYVVYF